MLTSRYVVGGSGNDELSQIDVSVLHSCPCIADEIQLHEEILTVVFHSVDVEEV